MQKTKYPLSFLRNPMMKKSGESEDSVYDYFIEQGHIDYSIQTAKQFFKQHVRPHKITVENKDILDISGGNGHFIAEFKKYGSRVALTEINKPTIDYARKTHNIPVYEFNFNKHQLNSVVDRQFDIILARAAIMFCDDLSKFANQCCELLSKDGYVWINHSVLPTLGVLTRVQLDEFSYWRLRQPETIIAEFEEAGFKLVSRADETDPSMYVYDHDMVDDWQLAHYLYEIPAARKIMKLEQQGKNCFSLRARDRRRSTMIFQKT